MNEDDWLAIDKLHHFLFCFSVALLFSALAARSRHPFLRRHSVWIGSLASFSAGAAKEAADELGVFRSAGASAKDFVADILGTAVASLGLLIRGRGRRPVPPEEVAGASVV